MSTIMYALGEHGGYSLDMKPEMEVLSVKSQIHHDDGDVS